MKSINESFGEGTPMTKTLFSVGSKTRTRKNFQYMGQKNNVDKEDGASFSERTANFSKETLQTKVIKNRKNKSLVTSRDVIFEKQKFMKRFKEANMLRTIEKGIDSPISNYIKRA